QITDLAPLGKLTALQSLRLSWCMQITDLAPLAKLTALQSLDLSFCEQITDLAPLGKLTALQSLDLSGCEQITDFAPLAKLTALQSLNLSGCEQITDLAPLAKLTALQSLNLSGCEQITDFAPLAKLPALQNFVRGGVSGLSGSLSTVLNGHCSLRSLQLDCIGNSLIIFTFPRLVKILSYRTIEVGNAPAELLIDSANSNILNRIIPWQRDILSGGAAPNTELKLFVLGNGRVGKTQISLRLQGKSYNPSVPSTHGVTLGRFPVLDAEGDHPAMHLNLWDFGGQDIYLGTHGLFLDDRAIYVVAWHPDHENDREFFENGIPMRNRPLAYWLAYIRSLAGEDAPIIVVQTQCDEVDTEVSPPLPPEPGFGHLKSTACSALKDYGLERLAPEIRAAARLLRKRYAAIEIPRSWVAVEDKVRKLRDDGNRTLSFDRFSKLCKERHSHAPPGLVAGFMHRAGQVFWREGAFGSNLVLDQAWALEGIYALLERNDTLPLIRERHGRFNLAQLQLKVWKDYGEEEQKLFLDMMTQCGACFPLGKDAYVATELLPSERTMEADIEGVWRNAEPDALVELHYDFLNDVVIKTILSSIGKGAGTNGVYWRSGLCYYDREAHGAALIRAEWDEGQSATRRGRIVVMVEGALASRLARHLVESIESIRIGSISQTVWQRGRKDAEAFRKEQEREAKQEPFSGIAPEMKGMQEAASKCAAPSALFSSNQQNILLFATEWESRHGGLSTFNRELCLAFARMGKSVCCALPTASEKEIKSASGVRLVPSGDETLLRKLPLPEGFVPDIIIGHGRITGEAAKAQQEDNYPHARRIHFIHMAPGQIEWYKSKGDAAQQAAVREQQELGLAKDAQLVAAVGPLLFRETSTLIERLPLKDRPRVCQFDPGFRRIEARTVPASLHCLLVGRAEDEALKGIDIAARALQQIDATQLPHKPELIVRGAPSGEGTRLQGDLRIRFSGVGVRVREYSSDAEEIIGDYRSAALTLMPSRCEGFGLVALESLSYGTPALISDKSGLAEMMKVFLRPHELQHYIVQTPDDCKKAACNWQERIYNQLSDIEAAISRANRLCQILEERLSWAKSCELLLQACMR
ncbi:MAG TPA: leucine-rich repeat domain-containing protein, partial [Rhodocyclaceae bacterium]|nr:leucine-rich repeat domain-containing protein [Rhodocyclaceae bacterium]